MFLKKESIELEKFLKSLEIYADESSPYALEGTSAHALAEYKLKNLLGIDVKDPTDDLNFYDDEMDELTDGYASYVAEVISRYESPAVFVEEWLDLSEYVKESFGTADCVVVGGNDLHIVDLKTGYIFVDAK